MVEDFRDGRDFFLGFGQDQDSQIGIGISQDGRDFLRRHAELDSLLEGFFRICGQSSDMLGEIAGMKWRVQDPDDEAKERLIIELLVNLPDNYKLELIRDLAVGETRFSGRKRLQELAEVRVPMDGEDWNGISVYNARTREPATFAFS